MSTRFLNRQISNENYENTWLYSTVLFFLVSQKCPTLFGSILATLCVSATTTIDICCATFFCTKNRESSRRREFSVPDSRTKTGRDVSLLAKLSLFYLSLGSKKISGDFGGSIGTTPWKFKASEPKKSPNWNPEHRLPNLPCLWVGFPPFNFPAKNQTVSKFAPCLAKYQKLTQKLEKNPQSCGRWFSYRPSFDAGIFVHAFFFLPTILWMIQSIDS